MHQRFQEDGVIAIRNLIPEELLSNLQIASSALVADNAHNFGRGKQFHTVKMGAIFIDDDSIAESFRKVALFGLIPRISTELLGLQPSESPETETCHSAEDNSMRLLRDVFLAKDNGEYVCGW